MIVYFVCRYFYPYLGGNEKQCLNLAKGLKEFKGVDVRIVTDHFSNDLLNDEKIYSIPIKRLNSISNLFYIGPHAISKKKQNLLDRIINRFRYTFTEYFFQLSVLIYLYRKRKNIDIIHFHQGSFTLVARLVMNLIKKPIIIKDSTYDGLEILRYLTVIPIPYKYYFQKINFIAISTQIKNNFITKYDISQDKIFLIPNGVDLTNVRRSDFIYQQCPKLLFLGNFWQGKIKGLDILLLAFAQVKNIFPDIKLIIAGSGNLDTYKGIINQYSLQENIEFVGSVSSHFEIFKENPIFILPSRSEGMSNSLLEAMAYGLPCISSKVSGSTDIIDDGLNGLLFDMGSVEGLVNCINNILNNPEKQEYFGTEAVKKINSSFKMEIIVQKYFELYASLI